MWFWDVLGSTWSWAGFLGFPLVGVSLLLGPTRATWHDFHHFRCSKNTRTHAHTPIVLGGFGSSILGLGGTYVRARAHVHAVNYCFALLPCDTEFGGLFRKAARMF